jgi:ribosomal protein S12 methylthiotransferase
MEKGKIALVSLGCPKNRCDAEIMLGKLASAGYEITTEESTADVIIINTCGFIQSAKEEAIAEILSAAELKKSGNVKALIVTGCLAERYREQVAKEFPEVNAVLGLAKNADIIQIVENILQNKQTKQIAEFSDIKGLSLEGERYLSTIKSYAYLRVADGCDNCCSYCAIPLIRGRFKSRPMENILAEAETLAKSGVKELLVIAQDTTRYGEDLYGELKLPELLKKLCGINGIEWIRVMYCYPERVTDELISVIKKEKKILKYIDMPLQHCNGELLHEMNRKGRYSDKESLRGLILKLRREIPGLILRTTFIAGLPGETEEQFTELAEFADEIKFEHMGCFAYSQEEGTPAAEMPGQLDEEIKARRAEIITEQQEIRSEMFFREFIGKTVTVIAENYNAGTGFYTGRTPMDAPEIDGLAEFTGGSVNLYEFVQVKLESYSAHIFYGEQV